MHQATLYIGQKVGEFPLNVGLLLDMLPGVIAGALNSDDPTEKLRPDDIEVKVERRGELDIYHHDFNLIVQVSTCPEHERDIQIIRKKLQEDFKNVAIFAKLHNISASVSVVLLPGSFGTFEIPRETDADCDR